MKLSIRAVILSIFLLTITVGGSIVYGSEENGFSKGRIVIMSIDIDSISNTNDAAMFESLTGILSTLQPGEDFYFSTMDHPELFLGPFEAGSRNFIDYKSILAEKINAYSSENVVSLPEVVSQAYNIMGKKSAPAGSTLYLLGQGEVPREPEYTARHLDPIAEMFTANGWTITGITPTNADPSMIYLLDRIAMKTGSRRYELTIDDALQNITNKIMTRDSLGALALSGQAALARDEILTSTIKIAPGTKDATVILFKEDQYGSLKLNSPQRRDLIASDMTSLNVVETPHTVIWQIKDPTSGIWTVDAKGMEGDVSSWHISSNKFRLNLGIHDIIPTGEPLNLITYVTEASLMVSPGKNSLVRATVTDPDGHSVFYNLNDDGKYGDANAGDNYYSATIANPESEGDYGVSVELGWDELPSTVIEQLSFRAQAFPQMEVTQLNTDRMYLERRSNIATIFVNVAGHSFPVDPSSIRASFGEGEDSGQLDIIPREGTSDGRAWMYDVIFTPREEGITTLALNLDIEYAGQVRQQVSEAITLTAISLTKPEPEPEPVSALAPAPAPEPVPEPVPYTTVVEVAPANPPIAQSTGGFAIGLIGIPIALIALIIAGFTYHRAQTRPFGFIDNEDGSLLVNFEKLERSFFNKLIFPSMVRGKETNIPELDGITFKFRNDKVDIETFRVSPTVRVNSKPVVGEITLTNSSWIGSHGRLFNFLTGKETILAEHGFGDD